MRVRADNRSRIVSHNCIYSLDVDRDLRGRMHSCDRRIRTNRHIYSTRIYNSRPSIYISANIDVYMLCRRPNRPKLHHKRHINTHTHTRRMPHSIGELAPPYRHEEHHAPHDDDDSAKTGLGASASSSSSAPSSSAYTAHSAHSAHRRSAASPSMEPAGHFCIVDSCNIILHARASAPTQTHTHTN